MICAICNHPKRQEIEQSLVCRSLGDSNITIDSIAEEFNVSARELQVHALMHAPLPDVNGSESDEPSTLTAAIKFKEAEILHATSQEYYATLKNLGVKINSMIVQHSETNPVLNRLSKATVDLYLGLGSEIRNTMDSMVKMNTAINGESDKGLDAIASLVNAIRGSDSDDSV